MSFKEKMPIDITQYLQLERDGAIKKILDILDVCNVDNRDKKKLRQVVLDEINNLYSGTCRVLTYIQEE